MSTTCYQLEIIPYTLVFHKPAGTSRGVYHQHKVWYIQWKDKTIPDRIGLGECAPLTDLSCDDLPDYEKILTRVCRQVEKSGQLEYDALRSYPSILFEARKQPV
jgi:hypothetical protein